MSKPDQLSDRTLSQDGLPHQRRRIILTVEEAAETLCIGRTTMYALIAAGDVESVRIGRLRRIPAQALEAYVERLRHFGGADVGWPRQDASYRPMEAASGAAEACVPSATCEGDLNT